MDEATRRPRGVIAFVTKLRGWPWSLLFWTWLQWERRAGTAAVDEATGWLWGAVTSVGQDSPGYVASDEAKGGDGRGSRGPLLQTRPVRLRPCGKGRAGWPWKMSPRVRPCGVEGEVGAACLG